MAATELKSEPPILGFPSAEAWEAWLAENHAASEGLWLRIAKTDSGEESVSYPEALEAALCWGWIDAQKNKLDERHWLQKFTPRRPRSRWSKVNCGHAERLITEGRMREAGLRQIEAAKKDGRWVAAYDSPSRAAVPDDLASALEENPAAKAFFETLTGVNRYAVLHRIQTVKKPETRARKIASFVTMLAEGRTIYP